MAQVDFIPEGEMPTAARHDDVALRFVRTAALSLDDWRTFHLALNCFFDPMPTKARARQSHSTVML